MAVGCELAQRLGGGRRGLIARVLVRSPVRVDAKAQDLVQLQGHIVELAQMLVIGAHIGLQVAGRGLARELKPESKLLRMRANVVVPEVGGHSGPVGRRLHVGLQQGARELREDAKIAAVHVVLLVSILNEVGVTLDVEGHIVTHLPEQSVVGGDGALVAVVDRVGLDEVALKGASVMRVCAVSPQVEGLAAASHLHVLDAVDHVRAHTHSVHAEQLSVRVHGIALDLHIARQQRHLTAEVRRAPLDVTDLRAQHLSQRRSEVDQVVVHGLYARHLLEGAAELGASQHQRIAGAEVHRLTGHDIVLSRVRRLVHMCPRPQTLLAVDLQGGHVPVHDVLPVMRAAMVVSHAPGAHHNALRAHMRDLDGRIAVAPDGKVGFLGVRLVLRAQLEMSTIDHNRVRIQVDVTVRVEVQLTLHQQEG
mmetsp:Transcript_19525/g.32842  ORF Transcript_19525/g.32842 Transcript_19525/m.32842 type:complete len:421 (-) Transcript_19525:621-1883(-)